MIDTACLNIPKVMKESNTFHSCDSKQASEHDHEAPRLTPPVWTLERYQARDLDTFGVEHAQCHAVGFNNAME